MTTSAATASNPRSPGDSIEKLAYDEAVRGIDVQRDSVDNLRTRAGTLLAAAALVTSFLGGQALRDPIEPGVWAVVALAAFVLVAAGAIVVSLPWKFDWFFDPNELVRDYVDDDAQMSTPEVLRDLALHHATARERNECRINIMQWVFRAAAFLLGVEVVAWLNALPGKVL